MDVWNALKDIVCLVLSVMLAYGLYTDLRRGIKGKTSYEVFAYSMVFIAIGAFMSIIFIMIAEG